jgi:hypothetical protein
MKQFANYLILIITLFQLAACATQSELTIYSQPEGAYISEIGTGVAFGIAPTVGYYDASALSGNVNAKGCYVVRGIEARWASGAFASLDPIELCGSAVGYYNITINRPVSHPDLEKDLRMALQIQAARSQQQQASAAEAAAAAAILGTFQQNQINCTSQNIGGIVSTNCR